MDLKTYLSAERGRPSVLAKDIGAHLPDVYAWMKNRRPVPIHFGIAIERATKGQVTRLDLFPAEVIIKVWPELIAKRTRKPRKIEQIKSIDDTQPPTGGTVSK